MGQLREEFRKAIGSSLDVLKIKENKDVDNCVKIANNHAIGFAEWYKDYPNNKPIGYNGKQLVYPTTEQLLEIYLTEKKEIR